MKRKNLKNFNYSHLCLDKPITQLQHFISFATEAETKKKKSNNLWNSRKEKKKQTKLHKNFQSQSNDRNNWRLNSRHTRFVCFYYILCLHALCVVVFSYVSCAIALNVVVRGLFLVLCECLAISNGWQQINLIHFNNKI